VRLNGKYRSVHFILFFSLTLVLFLTNIACGDMAGGAASAGQGSSVKAGDCKACHSGKAVLPEKHIGTANMKWQQCLMCHKSDKLPLKDRMPAGHTRMLSEDTAGKPTPPGSSAGAASAVKPGTDSSSGSGKSEKAKAAGPAPKCTACHSKPEYNKNFSGTGHGALGCSACHTGVTDLPGHMKGRQPSVTASCLACHKGIQEKGLHKGLKNISCSQCHGGIHPREARKAPQESMTAPAKAAASSIPLQAVECTMCHSDARYRRHFSAAAQNALNCTACHQGIRDIKLHMKKGQTAETVSCDVCHNDVSKKYEKSYHAVAAKLSCLQCHADIHPEKRAGREDRTAVIASCLRCHADKDKYVNKGHGAKVLAGSAGAAACTDCHKTHEMPFFASDEKGRAEKRRYYTELCISCHKEGGPAGSYGVFPGAVTAYGETYHGKAHKLGYLDRVAGCADCHLSHNILPADNPESVLKPAALVKTCGSCHEGFHPRFVSYAPHPDPDNPRGFFLLYLTKKFMIALLAGVFIFFWAHSLLWWRKAYAEKSRLVGMGVEERTDLPEEERSQYVRRFGVKERIMHVILILSFFGVVVSGFPIKYTEAPWAKALIALLGGVEGAALVHRVSAAAMIGLFLYTCWLSLKFLFPGFRVKGWLGRLFGPDSLFPRLKDIQDCIGMFKWFFNRGERPQFDRWTYWEKFDFMAVFWGMFVIGGSGLIMWIPELSSHVMPGWMINIVHLAHSEEAFLAAVFIFTVHFFNNHLVPDKFPLEKNIFTGSYTLEALKRERPLEYQRILEENRLKEIKCKGPGTGIQLFAGVFGIASVLVGLGLTILILWAVFRV
jgi:cytochrome b subunit of formate dehydrogenase